MNYTDKKQHLQDIRAKYREAKNERDELIERHNTIDAELNQAYDNYIQTQANAKAGQCTDKDVSKAEKRYLSVKNERDELDNQLEVSERVLSILKGKVHAAESDFHTDAVKYHREKLKPHFKNIQDSLDRLNAELEAVNEYRKELQKDQIPDSVLQGIKRHSKAVITTQNNGSLGLKDFITSINN